MAKATKEEKVFVAVMNTESFVFQAVGRTAAEAEGAIVRKFNELAPKRMSRGELREWYGLEAVEMAFGEATRY